MHAAAPAVSRRREVVKFFEYFILEIAYWRNTLAARNAPAVKAQAKLALAVKRLWQALNVVTAKQNKTDYQE